MEKTDFKAVCFIFARGGSKGLPGKNIRTLGGKPLIAHSIDIARANPRLAAERRRGRQAEEDIEVAPLAPVPLDGVAPGQPFRGGVG
ncbi:hypothetical protein EBZ70_12645, partial [bacterium]|nr:hypothetical protein [bacterium]